MVEPLAGQVGAVVRRAVPLLLAEVHLEHRLEEAINTREQADLLVDDELGSLLDCFHFSEERRPRRHLHLQRGEYPVELLARAQLSTSSFEPARPDDRRRLPESARRVEQGGAGVERRRRGCPRPPPHVRARGGLRLPTRSRQLAKQRRLGESPVPQQVRRVVGGRPVSAEQPASGDAPLPDNGPSCVRLLRRTQPVAAAAGQLGRGDDVGRALAAAGPAAAD
mmetsp:Transcript_11769/g.37374  ORF Transcript_11769/g.37374 Transcript_11769/m.37374 type:complete len:223 (-) Transcript_11769:337-1005(-)